MLRCDEDPNFLNNIQFSDDLMFCLIGTVHRHNCRYWSRENPHWTQDPQSTPKEIQYLNWNNRTVFNRALLFEGNLTAASYLNFLPFDLVPALTAMFPNDHEADVPHQDISFQQNGAPPHFGINVRQYLETTFPGM
jgi:hypothetical protein